MSGDVVRLTDRRVLEVSGGEARSFLQRLITNDVETLGAGQARYAALLTPQGKIVTDFFVVHAGEALLIDAPAATAADLAKKLTLYRLRAKVGIVDRSEDLAVMAFAPGKAPAEAIASYADPRDADLWHRAVVPVAAAREQDGDAARERYRRMRVGAGVPESGIDFAFGETFPHEANLDRLHGVDFRKGCYVGQEVVSRVHHRGTARKRIAAFDIEGRPPAAGSDIMAGDTVIGTVGSGMDGRVLGLVRLDRLDDAVQAGSRLTAAGVVLRHHIPG
jgi:folate-binding protein YgfZ